MNTRFNTGLVAAENKPQVLNDIINEAAEELLGRVTPVDQRLPKPIIKVLVKMNNLYRMLRLQEMNGNDV